MREKILHLLFPMGQETGSVLELFILNQLANEIPAWILIIGFILRRLVVLRQQIAAFEIKQVGRHHDKLAGQRDIQHLEGFYISEILLSNAFDGNIIDIHLILLDEIKQ